METACATSSMSGLGQTSQSGANWSRAFVATGGVVWATGLALQEDGVAVGGFFSGSSTLGMGASAPSLTSTGDAGFVHFSGR